MLFSFFCENPEHPHTVLLTQNTNIQYKKVCLHVYVCVCVEDIINWETCLQNVLEGKKLVIWCIFFKDTDPRRSGTEIFNFILNTCGFEKGSLHLR